MEINVVDVPYTNGYTMIIHSLFRYIRTFVGFDTFKATAIDTKFKLIPKIEVLYL